MLSHLGLLAPPPHATLICLHIPRHSLVGAILFMHMCDLKGVAPDPGTLSDSGAGWELIKVQHEFLDVALNVLAAAKASVASSEGKTGASCCLD